MPRRFQPEVVDWRAQERKNKKHKNITCEAIEMNIHGLMEDKLPIPESKSNRKLLTAKSAKETGPGQKILIMLYVKPKVFKIPFIF